jgi:hypothetical protein
MRETDPMFLRRETDRGVDLAMQDLFVAPTAAQAGLS